jgi:hypothetical protein
MGYIRDYAEPLVFDLDATPPAQSGCQVRTSATGACGFRWWHNCERLFAGTGESHFERVIEGKVVSANRFEGTATLNYLVASSCSETYSVVGVLTTESTSNWLYGTTAANNVSATKTTCPNIRVGSETQTGCCRSDRTCGLSGSDGKCDPYDVWKVVASLRGNVDRNLASGMGAACTR